MRKRTAASLLNTMTSDQTQIQLQQLHKLEQAGRFNEAGNAYQQLLAKNPGTRSCCGAWAVA